MFFNNGSNGFQNPQPDSNAQRPSVSRDKSSQIVDLRGYGGFNNAAESYQLHPQRKEETPFKENKNLFTSGKKSMIGHSDFVPVPDNQSTIIQPSPDLRGHGKDGLYGGND